MAIDFERVQKPARKLRKLLKTMSAEPTPEHVHDFRTNSRNMEATLQAFALENSGLGRRVLKPLSRLRKRAGKVRDMDVLTTYAASVDAKDGEKNCARSAAGIPRSTTPQVRQKISFGFSTGWH